MDRQKAVSQSLSALLSGDVAEAVAISGIHSGGAGALYERETVAIVESILKDEYTPDPALKPKVLESLRVVAAAMELWGARDVQEFAEISGDWTYKFKPQHVMELLHASGLQRHRLAHLRSAGVTRVEIRARNTKPGPDCRKSAGKTFAIDEAPALPHPDPSCRCSYASAPAPAPPPAADD